MRSHIIIGILIFAASALAQNLSAQDSLKIISPNGGEKYFTGADTVILWTGIPLTDSVKLEYSTDAGSTWILITDTATGGRYPWHIPGTVSGRCLVRVNLDQNGIMSGKWSKSFKGSDNQANAISTDAASNIYIAGTFRNLIDIGGIILSPSYGDNGDGYIAKMHPDGTIEWAKHIKILGIGSTSGDGDIETIVTDSSGNSYIGGWIMGTMDFNNLKLDNPNTHHDSYIAKIDPNGNILWAKKFDGKDQGRGEALAKDNQGNIYLSGFYSDMTNFDGIILHTTYSGGSGNSFISKFDTSGKVVWVQGEDNSFPASLLSQAGSIGFDGVRNIYIFGDFLDTQFKSVPFLEKRNSNGKLLFYEVFDRNSEISSLSTDLQGNSYVTGRYKGTINFGGYPLVGNNTDQIFLAKLRTDGTVEWINNIGGDQQTNNFTDVGERIVLDQDGNIYLAAIFHDSLKFGGIPFNSENRDNILLVKYLQDGSKAWSIQGGLIFPSTLFMFCDGLAIDNEGSIVLAGGFHDTAVFSPDTLASSGTFNTYIWKITPNLFSLQSDTSDALFSIIDTILKIKPKTLISIADDSGYAGDHKNIPLLLENAPISSVQSLATNFSARIAYDRTVLFPSVGNIQHGARYDTVTITGLLPLAPDASGTLALLPFVAMLGESTSSPMNIVDFAWLDGSGQPADYDVETTSGTFYLLGICPAGGNRLFNPDGVVSMAQIKPNPANGIIHIDIQTSEIGRTQLSIMNLLGQKIAIISDGELKPGPHSFDFDTKDISAGAYFLLMQTPTMRKLERIDVEK